MKNKTRILALLLVVLTLVMGVLGAAVAYAAEADNGTTSTVSDEDYGIEAQANYVCYLCGKTTTNGFCTASGCGGFMACEKNSDGYYEIEKAGQLYWFAGLVNGTLTDGTEQDTSANAVLTANITVNSNVVTNGVLSSSASSFRSWTPIGICDEWDSVDIRYSGTFDGQGHTISGLYNNASAQGGRHVIISSATLKKV